MWNRGKRLEARGKKTKIFSLFSLLQDPRPQTLDPGFSEGGRLTEDASCSFKRCACYIPIDVVELGRLPYHNGGFL